MHVRPPVYTPEARGAYAHALAPTWRRRASSAGTQHILQKRVVSTWCGGSMRSTRRAMHRRHETAAEQGVVKGPSLRTMLYTALPRGPPAQFVGGTSCERCSALESVGTALLVCLDRCRCKASARGLIIRRRLACCQSNCCCVWRNMGQDGRRQRRAACPRIFVRSGHTPMVCMY